jgi:Domain of unknown function (DUF4148)
MKGTVMKRQIAAVIIGSLFALPAFAGTYSGTAAEWDYPALTQAASKSRDEVLAELIQAERAGDVVANAETGEKANQLFPSAYPAQAAVAGKSRAEVLAELIEAERNGEIIANAETGSLENSL